MDRNSLMGMVLIVLILVGYNYFTAPSEEEIKAEKARLDSIARVEAEVTDSLSDLNESAVLKPSVDSTVPAVDSIQLAAQELLLKEKFGVFASASKGNEKEFEIATPKFTLTFSNKGASIKDIVLKDYLTYGGKPVHLFDQEYQNFEIVFAENNGKLVSTKDLFFTGKFKQKTFVEESDSLKLKYAAKGSSGEKLEVVYTIFGDRYDIRQEIVPVGLNNFFTGQNRARFSWSSAGYNLEKHLETEKQRCSVYYTLKGEDRDYLTENGDDEEVIEEPIEWIAFKQNFFSTVIIDEKGFAPLDAKLLVKDPQDTVHTKMYAATAALNPTALNTASYRWYFGPNDYHILNSYEVNELDRIIDFGWGIFGWVNKYFIVHVFRLLESINMSYGLIILVLTILIKLILSPLTYKNFVSSAKMRVLKPQIEEINQKHKNADPMKKQQEIMGLYRKTGVNPLAGCIPMLFQMPILYAMFRFFPASIELRQESFLWADDLSSYDSILDLPFEIPFYGDHVSLFTLLMCISTIGYTAMNSSQMPQQQEGMPNMKVMMYIFPIFMLFFFNNFSSGLSYYYFTANLLSITQMWVIKNYIIDEKKILEKIQENKEKNKGKGKSKFQKRLEEMAKQKGYNLPKN
ncbi:membrane protein insertase YidC [Luteibaculum oceani]|uniref:Membrane protein insertase YidC n=1 Tax=Luteibaculum oceani TaxID=1294296 RepID=A0A5C6VDH5_9FLAO|nr:membrane protein insertase YidC [Luteibaculum oceani]TXC81725.1 membrane protein insertase YidC [Luteibaculum oceani]